MKKRPSILFLTGNKHKFAEAQTILKPFGIKLIQKPAKGIEIQSDSVEEVARVCAKDAYRRFCVPLLVEDSGLFIGALKGFPGAYSAAIYNQVGCEGILRLLAQERRKSAKFVCALAYAGSHGVRLFRGVVHGSIGSRIHAGAGFGYDPIFIPKGHTKPFSAAPETKAKLSHRAKAFEAFGRFIAKKAKHDTR
ncbi:MAG: RdgB/HAM1 family non-canonical purine NTP pyrophosphatase [Candidatus Marsarchaeota archaeon]|nr:RdgB/HAM1 family non-canonical purine NTP pyrophosphatase [Candidatus Marsarchaeota archaeon]